MDSQYELVCSTLEQKFLEDDLADAVELIDFLGASRNNPAPDRVLCFENAANYSLHYAFSTAQKLEDTAWFFALDEYPEYAEKFSRRSKISYRIKRAIYHFNTGDSALAAEWSLRNLNDDRLKRFPEYQTFNHLIFLMANFELGNKAVVLARANSKLLAAATKPLPYKFEGEFLQTLIYLSENHPAENKIGVAERSRTRLIYLDATEKYSRYLALDLWLSSVLHKSDFTGLLQSKTKDLTRIPES